MLKPDSPCKKCGQAELFLMKKGIHQTIYCANCGTYQKHASKNEVILFEYVKEKLNA